MKKLFSLFIIFSLVLLVGCGGGSSNGGGGIPSDEEIFPLLETKDDEKEKTMEYWLLDSKYHKEFVDAFELPEGIKMTIEEIGLQCYKTDYDFYGADFAIFGDTNGKSTLILYSIPFRVNDGKLYTVKEEKCCCLCDVEGAEPQYWDYYDDSVYTVNTLNSTSLVLDNYLFTKKTESYEDDDSDDYGSDSPILSIRK